MLLKLSITITLVTITVSIHSFGIAALLRTLLNFYGRDLYGQIN